MPVAKLLPALLLVVATQVAAQIPNHLAVGDMLFDANTTELRVMPEVGFTSTPYTASVKHRKLLWDPQHPDSFYVAAGGSGAASSVQRMAFVGGGQIEYTFVAPGSSQSNHPLTELAFDQAGDLVMFLDGNIQHIDVDTGSVTPITSGNQLWGNSFRGGAVDTLTGDIYVSTDAGEIWRRGANGTVSLYTVAQAPAGIVTWVENLKIVSTAGPHRYLYYTMVRSLRRIDLNDPAKTEEILFEYLFPAGVNLHPVSYDFDLHGDVVIRDSTNEIWRIDTPSVLPVGGVQPTFLGSVAFSGGLAADIAIVGANPSNPFRFDIHPIPGGGGYFEIQNVPEPVGFGWILLSTSTYLPKGTGPLFGLLPDALTTSLFALAPQPGGAAFVDVAPPSFALPAPLFAPFIGTAWDGVVVSFSPGGAFVGQSNVSRVTWQ